MIRTNKELSEAVNDAIKDSGVKKVYIADQLGIKREALSQLMQKKNFSLDDANKILSVIGMKTETSVIKNITEK